MPPLGEVDAFIFPSNAMCPVSTMEVDYHRKSPIITVSVFDRDMRHQRGFHYHYGNQASVVVPQHRFKKTPRSRFEHHLLRFFTLHEAHLIYIHFLHGIFLQEWPTPSATSGSSPWSRRPNFLAPPDMSGSIQILDSNSNAFLCPSL